MPLEVTIPECPHCKQPLPPKRELPGIDLIEGLVGDQKISPMEWKLLRILVDRFGRVVSRSLIVDELWGQDIDGGPDTAIAEVRVFVCKLRQKLVLIGYTIIPAWGIGYKMCKRVM